MAGQRALVVEGGAMRGIFASGVLDAFLENNYKPYDFAVGVSAGASNLLGYLAGQQKRSYHVITELATDSRFFNPTRFLRGGNLIDVQWLWDESHSRFPLDRKTFFNAIPLLATVTNVDTGLADYYWVNEDNITDVIEATSALPVAYRQTPCFSGGCYTDGGVADSIPVAEAYRRGARDITVVLSHPADFTMSPMKMPGLMDHLLKKYPNIADAMRQRAERYNQSLSFIKNPPVDCKIRVIAPPKNFSIGRFTMKKSKLDVGYEMGKKAGRRHIAKQRSANNTPHIAFALVTTTPSKMRAINPTSNSDRLRASL
ncbi:patatin-like phospholipase family protein [Enterovibrio norvegicus]|uniref:Predicted phospholipase, patatin/cPLA2 family n=1 Tax=Enterovibrio norvegicus DSM 15893 TaxID=1121869 RepID=A0A1I5JTA3_9GAMM|nr:patatin family protein [Enterovibrio norvegicus]SFO75930.1 Predicted phospholipase, patatin/cPLA2 family [Enterovibrio norvegicus DSM 15893]